MKATKQNWSDIRKYYQGTFILVPEATHHVLYVDRVDESYIYVSDPQGEKGGIELTNSGYIIKDILPYKQYFQLTDNCAGVIQRKPARMWKKGIHQENTALFQVFDEGGVKAMSISHSTLETFQQSKGKFSNLEDFNPSKHRSMAISERMCVTNDGKLLMDSFVIGILSPKKKVMMPMKEFLPYVPKPNLWEIKPV